MDETTKKVAFGAALFAGFAYFSLSMIRDTLKKKSSKKKGMYRFCHYRWMRELLSNNCGVLHHWAALETETAASAFLAKSARSRKYSEDCNGAINSNGQADLMDAKGSQTDLTLPIGTRERFTAFHNLPPELWTPWAKSIQERIRDLNLRMVGDSRAWTEPRLGLQGFRGTPHLMAPHSLQPSPRHGTRATSPSGFGRRSGSITSISRSTENLSISTPPPGMISRESGMSCTSSRSTIGLNRVIRLPSETEINMYKFTLDKLYGKSNPNLSQQETSVLTMLLLSKDEDLLVRTLSVISNCAAFSINIVST